VAAGMSTHARSREIDCTCGRSCGEAQLLSPLAAGECPLQSARSVTAPDGETQMASDGVRSSFSSAPGITRRTMFQSFASCERSGSARAEARAVERRLLGHRRTNAAVGHSGRHATCDRGRRALVTASGPDGRRSRIEWLQRWGCGGPPAGGCGSSDSRCVGRASLCESRVGREVSVRRAERRTSRRQRP